MSAGPRRQAAAGRHGLAFWLVAYTFLVTMAFSAVPTPLYVLYQARDGFGALMVTVIFAAYAAGVMASLFLAGHLSDWLGRRRMTVAAVAVNVASGAAFLAAAARGESLAGLFLAGYAGLAIPVVGLGVATQALSAPVAVLAFAALLAAVIAVTGPRLLSHADGARRRVDAGLPPAPVR